MDFKILFLHCHRKFPYNSSLMANRRLYCKKYPEKGSVLVIPKRDDTGRFDWHLASVSKINGRKQMRVEVEYFYGEQ